jgi:hypothetical protein
MGTTILRYSYLQHHLTYSLQTSGNATSMLFPFHLLNHEQKSVPSFNGLADNVYIANALELLELVSCTGDSIGISTQRLATPVHRLLDTGITDIFLHCHTRTILKKLVAF